MMTTSTLLRADSISSRTGFERATLAVIPSLRSYARRLTQNEADRDDLVQDTLVRAWHSRHQFLDGTNLRAWLFRIARNCFLSGLRKSARSVQWDPDRHDRLLTSGAIQEDFIYGRDLERAFAHIPHAQREAFSKIVHEGLSYHEAALQMGLEPGTLKARVSRARANIMAFLAFGALRNPADPADAAECDGHDAISRYQSWKQNGGGLIG